MNRAQFDHLIRSAAGITCEKHFVVIGSQAILALQPDAPKSLRFSMELDVYPKAHLRLIRSGRMDRLIHGEPNEQLRERINGAWLRARG